jgi:putative transposase
MVFKLAESAQQRWRAVNAPASSPSSSAEALFGRGQLVERRELGAARAAATD